MSAPGLRRARRCALSALALALSLFGCTAQRVGPADIAAALASGDATAVARAYQQTIIQDPDSMYAAMARDGLALLTGPPLIAAPDISCSPEAEQAYRRAEDSFAADRPRAALPDYDRATTLCPDDALYWISAGDAYFRLGDYGRAEALFREGLRRDPWQRSGHRFLSDTESHLGNPAAAHAEAVLAVLSDPSYQTGWQWLKDFTVNHGGKWNRSFAVKPTARHGADGKMVVTIEADPGSETSRDGEKTLWLAYAMLRVAETSGGKYGRADWPPPSWEQRSPLERERLRVAEILSIRDAVVARSPEAESSFWRHIATARVAGFLDEAIYLNLLDAELVPEYVAYRAEQPDRLVRYMREQLAPLPTLPGKGSDGLAL